MDVEPSVLLGVGFGIFFGEVRLQVLGFDALAVHVALVIGKSRAEIILPNVLVLKIDKVVQ